MVTEMSLQEMAEQMIVDVTDGILKRNLLACVFFAGSGNFRAFQDLLDFVEETTVYEVLDRVSPSLFEQFITIVTEARDEASNTLVL